jgi:hypothetical protein
MKKFMFHFARKTRLANHPLEEMDAIFFYGGAAGVRAGVCNLLKV